jgi:hypothetical protein
LSLAFQHKTEFEGKEVQTRGKMDKSFDFGDRSALLKSKRSDNDSGLASEQDESNVIVNYPVLDG